MDTVNLTPERVQELLDYNTGTGQFTWRNDMPGGKKAGDSAGCFNKANGHWVIGIDMRLYGAHRLAWLLVNKTHAAFVYHINGNLLDNRIDNLASSRPCKLITQKHDFSEEWNSSCFERRPVVGYERFYEVDSNGRLFSLKRECVDASGKRWSLSAKIRSTRPNSNDYVMVLLSDGKSKRTVGLHRLVCMAFHGMPTQQRPHVNHKNGIRSDNRAVNLEWVSHSENISHAFQVLKRATAFAGKFGGENPGSKPVVGVNGLGEIAVRFNGLNEAQRHGYSAGNISMCISGQRKSHKGLKWRFDS